MKRCSASLIIREMQIKTTMRYHFRSVRVASIQKTTNKEYWQGCREKGTLIHCWWIVNWCIHFEKQYGDSSQNKK